MATKHVSSNPKLYNAPIGPTRPTPYQNNAVYDAGAQAKAVGHEIGQNPYVKHNATRSGFTAPVTAAPHSPTSRQQYQGAPVNDGSVMHPGNTTYIIKCADGMCDMKERKQRTTPPSPQRRPWQTGGLGGNDPGF